MPEHPATVTNPYYNALVPADVDRNFRLTPRDILLQVVDLNTNGSRRLVDSVGEAEGDPGAGDRPPAVDANNDGFLTPGDVLQVARALSGEGASDPLVQFMYEVKDEFGNPLTNPNRVKAGSDFRLEIYGQDLRPQAQGIFSMGIDILYDDASLFDLVYGERQKIELIDCACDGTFTLTFDGETTAPINAGQSVEDVATSIQTALEGLPSVEPGDIEVLPIFPANSTTWFVRFIGQYQGTDVPLMTIDTSNLTPSSGASSVTGTITELDPADVTNVNTFRSSFVPDIENWVRPSGVGKQGSNRYEDISFFTKHFFGYPSTINPSEPILIGYTLLHAGDEPGQVRFTAAAPDDPAVDVTLIPDPTDLLATPELIDYTTADITVIIERPVNAIDDAFNVTEDASNVSLDVLANDFLEDGSSGTLDLDANGLGTPDQGGTVSVSNGVILYTPAADFFGTETFTYTAIDGLGNSDTATVTITIPNINDPPEAVDDLFNVQEDSVDNMLDVLGNDVVGPANENETLTITSVSPVSHPADFANRVMIDNGQIKYTPIPDFFGQETFTYEISDGNGGTDTATVIVDVVNVNDDPTANDDVVNVLEDSAPTTLDVLSNDTIAPDANETLTITGLTPINVQADFATRVTTDGATISYQPAPDFFGTEQFSYDISDGNGGTDTAIVDVTVDPVNDPPTAVDDPLLTAVEFVPTPQTLDVLANDSSLPDDPNEDLTIVSVSPVAGQFDPDSTITIASDGKSVEYIPNPNQAAVFFDVFTYTIQDPGGLEATATGTIEVLPLVRPKARDDNFDVDEDSQNNVLDVTGNPAGRDFFNEDAQNKTLVIITPPANGVASVSGLNIIYTPTADYFGPDTIVYEIDDELGDPSQAMVSLTVNNVNDPPVANDDVATVTEDTSDNFIDVLSNDNDGVDEGETLSVTSAQGVGGFQGTLAVATGGTGVLYTPAPDFFGQEQFTYEISDGNGGTATATVTVTVENTNDDPTAVDDVFTVDEDTTNDLDVLQNDSDAPDTGEVLTVTDAGFGGTSGTTQVGGTVQVVGNQVRYTPPADFFGTDTFTYDISDGNGGSAMATVTVTVDNVNDDPTANDDTTLALKNFTDQAIDVLANDEIAPDVNETLTIISVTQPSNGSVVIVGGTTVEYTPNANYEGPDSFQYTISDGNGGEDTAQVDVDVVDAIPSDVSGFLYIDADNDGEFDEAEPFTDTNGNGRWEVGEPFTDLNGNGFRNAAELRLAGIDVTITGETIKGNIFTQTLTTDKDGKYVFEDVLPSSLDPGDPGYTLSASQGSFLLDGKDSIGDQGGVADSTNDRLEQIKLDIFGTPNAQNNRFGERGVKSEFLTVAELFASSSPFGAIVATNTSGDQFWFALMEGWDNVASVSMTDLVIDADNSDKVTSVKLTVQFTNNSTQTMTIDKNSPHWKHFRVMGHDDGDGYILRIDATLDDMGLAQAEGEGRGGAEGEAAEYADHADAYFSELGWA